MAPCQQCCLADASSSSHLYSHQRRSGSKRQGVSGKAVTPFLLARLAELTGGRTLRANVALLAMNARVAGEIAVAYARLRAG